MSPPIPSGVTLAALARDEGDGSSRGSNDESEVSGSNLAEEMTVVRARENLYKQSGKMGLNGKKINWKFWAMIMVDSRKISLWHWAGHPQTYQFIFSWRHCDVAEIEKSWFHLFMYDPLRGGRRRFWPL